MNELSLVAIFNVIKKQLWKICAAAAACAVAAFLFCSFIATPTYRTKVSLLGSNGGVATNIDGAGTISNANVTASLALINTYVGILGTDGIYEKTATESGLSYSAKQLRSMISVSARSEDSLFIDVTVTCTDKNNAVKIANTFLNLAEDYIVEVMPNAYVRPLDPAKSVTQNYPRTTFTVALAALAGAAVVILIALIVSTLDHTIKGEEDFSANYTVPVLGNIPNFNLAVKENRKYEK